MDYNGLYASLSAIKKLVLGASAPAAESFGRLRLDVAATLSEATQETAWMAQAVGLDELLSGIEAEAVWNALQRRHIIQAPPTQEERAFLDTLGPEPSVGRLAAEAAIYDLVSLPAYIDLIAQGKKQVEWARAQIAFRKTCVDALASAAGDAVERACAAREAFFDSVARLLDKTDLTPGDAASMLRPLAMQMRLMAERDFPLSLGRGTGDAERFATWMVQANKKHGLGKEACLLAAALHVSTPEFMRQAGGWALQSPPWRAMLLDAASRPVKLFRDAAHMADYEAFVAWIFDSAGRLKAEMDGTEWYDLALTLVRQLKIATLYGAPSSLVGVQRARGALIDNVLRASSTSVDVPQARLFRDGAGRARVGFIVAHTGESTETFAGLAHIAGLDRSRFLAEVFICPHDGAGSLGDALDRFVAASDAVFDLGSLSVADRADFIRARGLSALIIVNSNTWGYSDFIALSAHRLALVQAAIYTAVSTTGLRNADIWLSAAQSENDPDPQRFYTERLVCKEGMVLCFTGFKPDAIAPSDVERSETIVFVSGANFYKLNDQLWSCWMQILERTPNSVLRLYPFNPNWDQDYPFGAFEIQLASRCRDHGIERSRIELLGPWPERADMLRNLAQADIYLDSFPHCGGLSTLDPLMVGVPVATFRGDTQKSTQGANVLEALGLQQWIAATHSDYVDLAVAIAADRESARAAVRAIDLVGSRLFDVAAFGGEISTALAAEIERAGASAAGDPVEEDLWVFRGPNRDGIFHRPKRFPRGDLQDVVVDFASPPPHPNLYAQEIWEGRAFCWMGPLPEATFHIDCDRQFSYRLRIEALFVADADELLPTLQIAVDGVVMADVEVRRLPEAVVIEGFVPAAQDGDELPSGAALTIRFGRAVSFAESGDDRSATLALHRIVLTPAN